jgi:hypothetical protein
MVEKIRDEQFPPKPNELLNTFRTFCPLRKRFSGVNGNASIFVVSLRFG